MATEVKKHSAIKKIIILFLKIILVIIFGLIIIGGYYAISGYSMYKSAIKSSSIEERVNEIEKSKGYVSYKELPKIYIDSVVAIEDKDFFSNNGFDFEAIINAIIRDVRERKFAEGGSTITQQLAKNMLFNQKKNLRRKAAEVFAVIYLNKNYSKEKIFELYVNSIYFGNNYYGIYNACKGYFGIEPKNMNALEATMLAGIPNAPTIYALNKNLPLAKKRQEMVISALYNRGFISKSKYNKLREEAKSYKYIKGN